MASHSASGLTKEEREAFLRDHGYVMMRTGKGSHQVWEHPEMKMLCRSRKCEMPENLRSNSAQHAWEITLPCDPASGTWRAISKQVQWASGKIDEIKAGSERDASRCEIVRQFRRAVEEICAWKKEVKHTLRMGLDVPNAPESYHRIAQLRSDRFGA